MLAVCWLDTPETNHQGQERVQDAEKAGRLLDKMQCHALYHRKACWTLCFSHGDDITESLNGEIVGEYKLADSGLLMLSYNRKVKAEVSLLL